jgi:hypothetical protein
LSSTCTSIFGPYERRLALLGLVVEACLLQHVGEHRDGAFPQFRFIDVLAARSGQGEPEARRDDAECAVGLADQLQRADRLVGHLVDGAEDVRVVELDRAHPGQPGEHAGAFRPVHPAELGHPQRQLPIAVRTRTEDERVVRAKARAQHELLAAQVHRREHVVLVVRPVP